MGKCLNSKKDLHPLGSHFVNCSVNYQTTEPMALIEELYEVVAHRKANLLETKDSPWQWSEEMERVAVKKHPVGFEESFEFAYYPTPHSEWIGDEEALKFIEEAE